MKLHLPTAFVPTRHHFGLSISRTSIRAVELDKKQHVRVATEVLLPEDVFQEGVLSKKEVMMEALKKLLASGKFTTSFVSVCFSESYAYSREYTVPILSPAEMHEAVSWHIKDLFPFPESELYFDWRILSSTEKEHRLIVTAVPKKVMDPFVDTLISVGLKPVSFSPGASAIAQLLKLTAEEQALVVEVNKVGAYVTLVEGEKTLFTTVVNNTVTDTPQTYLINIVQTAHETIAYFKKKTLLKEKALRVVLTGELAAENWLKDISKSVPYPLQVLITEIKYPAFNKAYAMAISPTPPPYDLFTINLLPHTLQKTYDTQWRESFYSTLGLRAIVVAVILFAWALGAFVSIDMRRQALENQITSISTRVKNKKGSTQDLLLLNAQAGTIVQLAPLRVTPKEKLAAISNLLTNQIQIAQWDYDDKKLMFTLHGVAVSREILLDFKKKLEDSGEFAKVTLPLGSLEAASNVKFSISFVSSN